MKIEINTEIFELLPDKTLFWPEQQTLIIADCHFGKEAVFQQHTIPIPYGSTITDLLRIDKLLEETAANRIIFLGDFFHGAIKDIALTNSIYNWCLRHSTIKMLLIIGNHDRHMPLLKEMLPMEVVPELEQNNFLFTHTPQPTTNQFNIAGHLHPVFNLQYGRHRERLPCFYRTPQQLILPAFGSFTGGFAVKKETDAVIYLITPEAILPLSLK